MHRHTIKRSKTVVSAKWLLEHREFSGLKAFVRIEASRETDEKTTSETRCFALSKTPAPEVLLYTVGTQWAITERPALAAGRFLSRVCARNRKDISRGKIAVLLRRTFDLFRRDTSKGSLSINLKRSAWDDAFLRSIHDGLAKA